MPMAAYTLSGFFRFIRCGALSGCICLAAMGAHTEDLTVALDHGASVPLQSEWAEYFGTHYARSPEDAGVVWNTVRSYGGTHCGFYPSGAGEAHKGPFTGKEVRLSLDDFHGARGGKSGEELFSDIMVNRFTAIYLTSTTVRPTLEDFDKDLMYWAVRLVHEKYPDAYRYVAWQTGNEVVSGHFDPKGLHEKLGNLKEKSVDGKFFGYDLDWKEEYYVNRYLAPAVEAIERASRDVYGDPYKIKILLGSMNPYNRPNVAFLENVMNRAFDSVQAPTLKGEPVWKHVDAITVHYMTGSENSIERLQEYHNRYLVPGKVDGIWLTEDHGAGGKGTVTMVQRGFRFLAWAARNHLSAEQTRLVWWGDNARKPGGAAREAEETLGRFLAGLRLRFLEQPINNGRLYALTSVTPISSRILLVIVTDRATAIDVENLQIKLGDGFPDGPWVYESVTYAVDKAPAQAAPSMSGGGRDFSIPVNTKVDGACVLMLAAKAQG